MKNIGQAYSAVEMYEDVFKIRNVGVVRKVKVKLIQGMNQIERNVGQ
jgi:hypothetical protein